MRKRTGKIVLMTVLIVTCLSILLIGYSRQAKSARRHLIKRKYTNMAIPSDETLKQLKLSLKEYEELPLCPEIPPGLKSHVTHEDRWQAFRSNHSVLSHVQRGGAYTPRDCRTPEHVAIIVPYRDRSEHLSRLLVHLHQFLPRQKIRYRILVAEMTNSSIFNTGIMQNVGFKYAELTDDFTCYVIHDVDLMPTNENNLYKCDDTLPVHLAPNNSKYNNSNPYEGYFGGVVAVRRNMFYAANGFSNLYFGWGGQDDDFRTRLIHVRLKPRHVPSSIGTYWAIPHRSDPGNPQNFKKDIIHKNATGRMHEEGLNSLRYKLLNTEERPLYTWVLAEVNQSKVMEKYSELA